MSKVRAHTIILGYNVVEQPCPSRSLDPLCQALFRVTALLNTVRRVPPGVAPAAPCVCAHGLLAAAGTTMSQRKHKVASSEPGAVQGWRDGGVYAVEATGALWLLRPANAPGGACSHSPLVCCLVSCLQCCKRPATALPDVIKQPPRRLQP